MQSWIFGIVHVTCACWRTWFLSTVSIKRVVLSWTKCYVVYFSYIKVLFAGSTETYHPWKWAGANWGAGWALGKVTLNSVNFYHAFVRKRFHKCTKHCIVYKQKVDGVWYESSDLVHWIRSFCERGCLIVSMDPASQRACFSCSMTQNQQVLFKHLSVFWDRDCIEWICHLWMYSFPAIFLVPPYRLLHWLSNYPCTTLFSFPTPTKQLIKA